MKKIIIIVLVIALFSIGVGYLYGRSTPRIPPTSQKQTTITSVTQTDATTVASEPSLLSIPTLSVQAQVESVGLDSKRNMDVPKNAQNVAWYNLGALPGEQGNAVIAGHFDTVTGAPAIFYNLNDLQKGDELIVTDKKGNKFTYQVTEKKIYKVDDFPLQEVFGETENFRLNLITCSGSFNSREKNYSHRTVIYSELAQ